MTTQDKPEPRAHGDMRMAFEVAARIKGYNLCRNYNSDHGYAFPAADGAWFGWQAGAQWQASRQAIEQPPQSIPDPEYKWSADGKTVTLQNWDEMLTAGLLHRQSTPTDLHAAILGLPIPEPRAIRAGHGFPKVYAQAYTYDQMCELRRAAATLVANAAPAVAAAAMYAVALTDDDRDDFHAWFSTYDSKHRSMQETMWDSYAKGFARAVLKAAKDTSDA